MSTGPCGIGSSRQGFGLAFVLILLSLHKDAHRQMDSEKSGWGFHYTSINVVDPLREHCVGTHS